MTPPLPSPAQAAIEREVGRYGDVTGYVGSRYTKPTTPKSTPLPPHPVTPASLHHKAATLHQSTPRRIEHVDDLPAALRRAGAGGGDASAASELHFNNGSVQIDIDANGVKVTYLTSGSYVYLANNGVFECYSGTNDKFLGFDPALLTHDMGIREIGYYDAGVPKTILTIASESY